ncbi:flavanone 3-dioxygenase 3 [Arachis stenosperma]|uniref:flavanone 3-dioxygenase 3 n=1 Tax=Arachis stenosperma TaxID=217475 RepID=UPI0025AB7453|nr:flavanone 3-dioxygenase 3 [Arachis stenosperma]
MDHDKEEKSSSLFSTGNSAQEMGFTYVPQRYVVPTLQRPSLAPKDANVAVIDIAALRNNNGLSAENRFRVIQEISDACRSLGFFQIVNHGISESVLEGAISVASKFFDLPTKEKLKLGSSDVRKPVRYATSLKDGVDKHQFWRVFLKHYAHPLNDWIHMWPDNPPDYREKMGRYCEEIKKVSLEVMEAILESLKLKASTTPALTKKLEDGMQVMAVNCYPPCPEPAMALGLPPHSDYSCLTIVYQNCQGLEIMDSTTCSWKLVPHVPYALQVHIGDHFEVLSNGLFKSVVHRATLHRDRTRFSIVSLFSLGMDDKMGVAAELIDDDHDDHEHPKKYRESSFRDFLDFLASNDIAQGKNFIDTLKIEKNN